MNRGLSTKRCWIGKEAEHNNNYGSLILFVEADEVDFQIVYNLLEKYPDCKHIYLGAGELDVESYKNMEIADKIIERGIDFTLECSSSFLNEVSRSLINLCSTIVIRTFSSNDLVKDKKVFMKYRTVDDVYMSMLNFSSRNSLKDLIDMRYKDDILIYTEEKV